MTRRGLFGAVIGAAVVPKAVGAGRRFTWPATGGRTLHGHGGRMWFTKETLDDDFVRMVRDAQTDHLEPGEKVWRERLRKG